MRNRIKNIPFFPIVPFVPLAIIGGLITLQAFTLARLRRLARRVEELSSPDEQALA